MTGPQYRVCHHLHIGSQLRRRQSRPDSTTSTSASGRALDLHQRGGSALDIRAAKSRYINSTGASFHRRRPVTHAPNTSLWANSLPMHLGCSDVFPMGIPMQSSPSFLRHLVEADRKMPKSVGIRH